MRDLLQDLRFGVRNLAKAPAFTTAAVLALALGIGCTTAVFSLVYGVVLKPLPYADPERLVSIWEANREGGLDHGPISPVNFMDYRALSQVFTDATAWWRPEVTLRDASREPVRVGTIEVSGNFHAVLGVSPALGAGFPEGQFHSPDRIALISDRLWTTRFGSDASIVGRIIRLNDDDYTVAGVMPPGFHFPGDTDVWQRLSWDLARHSRGAHFMEAVARLKPGVDVARARAELQALSGRLGNEFSLTNRGWHAWPIRLHDEVVGYFRPALLVLLGAVGLLLLIACINVASLLLARAASRAREVAVRAAIGATRRRLVRQFLSESLLLAIGGGVLGVALAFAAMRAIVALTPVEIPRLDQVAMDGRVLAFAMLVALGTAIVFGLLPALFMSRVDLQQALKEGGRSPGAGRGGHRIHRTLVTAEIALAVMLLAGAGLLLRSVSRLAAEDPGFRPADVTTAGIQLSGAAYAQWPGVERFHSALVESLGQQPGVEAAGASNFLPLAAGWRVPFLIRGQPAPARGDEPTAQYHTVSEGYLETLGVPRLAGRLFDAHDTVRSRGVVVINQTLAMRYFPGQDPVGQIVRSLSTQIGPLGRSLMTEREHEIIGVVGDVKNSSLQGAVEPALYHTQRQFPFRHMYVVARGDPKQVGDAIRAAVRAADPGLPMPELRSMTSVVGESIDRPRFLMFIMGVFAASALALAALGIYGVLSYAVTERQQELSIRMALGAQRSGVLWMVMRQGLALAAMGCVVGAASAYAVARQIGAILYGVSPGDPATMTGVAGLALAIAALACAVPAYRASRLQPLEGLRE